MSFFGRHYRHNKALTTVLLSSILKALVHLRKGFKDLDKDLKAIEKASPRSPEQQALIKQFIERIHAGMYLCTHIHDNLNTLLFRDDKELMAVYDSVINGLKTDEGEYDDELQILHDRLERLKRDRSKGGKHKIQAKIHRDESIEKDDQKKIVRLQKMEATLRKQFREVKHDEELSAKYRLNGVFNFEAFKEFDLRKAYRLTQKMIYKDIKLDWLQKEVHVSDAKISKQHMKLAKQVEKEALKLLRVVDFETLKDGVLMHRLLQRMEKVEHIVEQYPACELRTQYQAYQADVHKMLHSSVKQAKRFVRDDDDAKNKFQKMQAMRDRVRERQLQPA